MVVNRTLLAPFSSSRDKFVFVLMLVERGKLYAHWATHSSERDSAMSSRFLITDCESHLPGTNTVNITSDKILFFFSFLFFFWVSGVPVD